MKTLLKVKESMETILKVAMETVLQDFMNFFNFQPWFVQGTTGAQPRILYIFIYFDII